MAAYVLGLVHSDGTIIGTMGPDGKVHAHSEKTRVLEQSEPGVGRKGDVVRVPHPLEDPNEHSDGDLAAAGDDVHLALLSQTTDPDTGGIVSKIVRIFQGVAWAIREVESIAGALTKA